MGILSEHFRAAYQFPLQGDIHTIKAGPDRFVHALETKGFCDEQGALYHQNHIYQATASERPGPFESLNLVLGANSLGFALFAGDRPGMEKLFDKIGELVSSSPKKELYSHLAQSYEGFGLEIGLIHTDSPDTSFVKLLGAAFGAAGFMRDLTFQTLQYAQTIRGAKGWIETSNFLDLHTYCDAFFEDKFGAAHTLNLFKHIAKDPQRRARLCLDIRDPKHYALLTSKCEQESLAIASESPSCNPLRPRL